MIRTWFGVDLSAVTGYEAHSVAMTDPSEAVAPAAAEGGEEGTAQAPLPNVDTRATVDGSQPVAVQAGGAASSEGGPAAPLHDDIYHVKLEGFEGPLDLLLHLIRKHELDILDIPISFITSKYLEYLKLMGALQLDVASEYLVMSATLAYIKSRTLLPPDPDAEGDEEDVEEVDPREELVRRLLEYQKYKSAAADLKHRATLAMDTFERGSETPVPGGPTVLAPVNTFRLFDAFQRILKRNDQTADHQVLFEKMSITEKVVEITELLHKRRRIRFEALFFPDGAPEDAIAKAPRELLIITFLAFLEMCKMGIARIIQEDVLGTLCIELASKHLGPDDEPSDVADPTEVDEPTEVAPVDDVDDLSEVEASTFLDEVDILSGFAAPVDRAAAAAVSLESEPALSVDVPPEVEPSAEVAAPPNSGILSEVDVLSGFAALADQPAQLGFPSEVAELAEPSEITAPAVAVPLESELAPTIDVPSEVEPSAEVAAPPEATILSEVDVLSGFAALADQPADLGLPPEVAEEAEPSELTAPTVAVPLEPELVAEVTVSLEVEPSAEVAAPPEAAILSEVDVLSGFAALADQSVNFGLPPEVAELAEPSEVTAATEITPDHRSPNIPPANDVRPSDAPDSYE